MNMDMDMSMSSGMDMPMSTGMDMPMSTGMDMPMSTSGMDMGHMGMGSMDMMPASMMDMVFFNSHTTKLYSSSWAPQTVGQYAGTCIFLIVLAGILRALIALKTQLERRWLRNARKRRYIVNAASRNESTLTPQDSSSFLRRRGGNRDSPNGDAEVVAGGKGGAAVLTSNGLNENVRVVESSDINTRQPWRLSVDLPRACLVTVVVGIAYLLMLAVMTLNIGYFLSILAGTFLSDLFVGRFAAYHAVDDHNH